MAGVLASGCGPACGLTVERSASGASACCEVRLMLGFITKLWRRHKAEAADRRIYLDQGHSLGHATDDAQRIVTEHSVEHRLY